MDQKTTLLFASLPPGGEVPEEGRHLSAVMLRRLLSTEFTEFYKNLNEEQKAQFKAQVLTLMQNEPSKAMRRKLVDLVAEISRNLMDDEGNNLWPEFLKFLFEMASSPHAHHKETSLLLFRYVIFIFEFSRHLFLFTFWHQQLFERDEPHVQNVNITKI